MNYCPAHDRYFHTQDALNNHYNSPAHWYENDHYCEECDRYFNDRDALDQHLNSAAHNIFYCRSHNRYFLSQGDLDNHYNSSAHDYEDEEEDEEEWEEEEEEEEWEDEEDSWPPPFPELEGKGNWVLRNDFQGKKSFGYYICKKCENNWFSAHAHKVFKQGCQSCEFYNHPIYMWENYEKNQGKNTGTCGPHDRKRCEACSAGDCLGLMK